MTTRSARGLTILVADDDPVIRSNLSMLLRSEGYTVREAVDGDEAAEALANPATAAALLDLNMPKQDGLAVLRGHGDRVDEVPVIVITAYGGSVAAIEAMKLGAYDYVTKPFDIDEVLFTLRRALTQRALIEQVHALSVDPLAHELDPEEELIGRSPAMVSVFKMIGRIAATDESVLILGESGTGKELVANAIHRNSHCSNGPFVKINSAALSPSVLESELFGHEKGSFTGAIARRHGRFEQANGGTLFLDEIGELGGDLQAKLLRVLQTGTFERVGGEETLKVSVRVLAATNRDLKSRMANGEFREDLYYRLAVVTITLPALRERMEDIPLLAEYIVRQLAQRHGWPGLALASEAVEELARREWPGNVREMRNVLACAAILARGKMIRVADLTSLETSVSSPTTNGQTELNLHTVLADTERRVIQQALDRTNWNRTQAARLLGISRRQLFDKIQLYGFHQ